nr:glycosyltransferase [Campylobacter sp.]
LPLIAYKLAKIVKKHKFSQIVSFLNRANYINILAKFISKHNAIISERHFTSLAYQGKSLNSLINKFLTKWLYKKANLIICVSNLIKQDLENNFGIKTQKIVIYNPYDIEKITKLSIEQPNFEICEKSIICVGSLKAVKNHQMLIRAFSKISDKEYKLYILGEGRLLKDLQNLVSELNLDNRVVFLGFDNNPYKYLSKAKIFVLSSNSEGFPNVLVEAMICGLPVISTDCKSGPREILAQNTDINLQLKNDIELAKFGILTPINDIDKMTKAINLMIQDENLRNQYAKSIATRAMDFDISFIKKQYLANLNVSQK